MSNLNAADLRRFEAELKRLIEAVEIGAKKAVRLTTLELWRDVVAATPVDTGQARAGWMIDVRPTDDVPPPGQDYYPPPAEPTGLPLSARLFLFNNVAHIVALEFGSSDQAPHGMLRTALVRSHRRVGREFKRQIEKELKRRGF